MKNFLFVIAATLLVQPLFSQKTEDEKAIHQVVKTMTEGWTAGSGEQFASVFADEHDYIVWNGYYLKGINPQINAMAHQGLFNSVYKDTEQHATVDKIKFIREDLALIHVLSAPAKKGEARPKDPVVLWTAILEKKNDAWKIISFHNLDLEVFQNEEIRKQAPMPAEVMYGSWYADGGRQTADGGR